MLSRSLLEKMLEIDQEKSQRVADKEGIAI